MDNNEDKRGYDLRVDNFKSQLLNVINNSNINISTAYYVVKDICTILENNFNRMVDEQYQQFCNDAKQEAKEEDRKDEAE